MNFVKEYFVQYKARNLRLAFIFLTIVSLFGQKLWAGDEIIAGSVRVQLLSGSLVRIEARGPEGFEDRTTFHILNRDWPGTGFQLNTNDNVIEIRTSKYTVHLPVNASSLEGIWVESADKNFAYHYDGILTNSVWLPGPSDHPQLFTFADTPRIIPSRWGLTPQPNDVRPTPTSGWDLNSDAPDIYVFVPGGDYWQLRKDFLQLTGPSEMPPLYAFGAFDSRWHDYSEETALQQVDDYRAHNIPLDNLVIDTGWRIGASIGYQPNTNLFPDMGRFLREAHAKHVHVMFNDHPEPKFSTALDPGELKYRYDNLTYLLDEGLDIWWFDRNWIVALNTPALNLRKEVWGQRLYHDTTLRDRPNLRPIIMANVDGIDNGIRNRPMDVAAHRFSIQWTGDIQPGYDYLTRGVENAVHAGVQSLFPYMSEDLGGHVADPTPEGYIRWIEYGALSPVYRPHCTFNHERMPWAFGVQAEEIARRFLNMRYRLLPVFYAAAHENYETGEPLLRRLDLDYPDYNEAARDDEYLLGKNILVAPVLQGSEQTVPESWLKTPDGQTGLKAEYFGNEKLEGQPVLTRTDKDINFNWSGTSPDPRVPANNFSARWTGTIQLSATLTGAVDLATVEDDGARVFIDGRPVIDAWGPHDSTVSTASQALKDGQPHQLRIEYQQLEGNAVMRFEWNVRGQVITGRSLWIPPGHWMNAWSGEVVQGPANIVYPTPLGQEPIFIKAGAIIPLAPEMQYTSEKPWDPITLDLYPAVDMASATLYEDDTVTVGYKNGQFRNTLITSSTDNQGHIVSIQIDAAQGQFKDALPDRAWKLRLHQPLDWPANLAPTEVILNGQDTKILIQKLPRAKSAMPLGDSIGAPDGDVYELSLPASDVSKQLQIKIIWNPASD